MFRTCFAATVTTLLTVTLSAATYLLGIWTGGNPEAFCDSMSGVVNNTTCMDTLGQIINIGGMQ